MRDEPFFELFRNTTNCGVPFKKKTLTHDEILSEQWKVYFKDYHLFTIKESLIPGAGYGCFAGQNFKANQIIGLYHGEVMDPSTSDSVYMMHSEELNVTLGVARGIAGKSRNIGGPFYFGLHFCNDATKCVQEVVETCKKRATRPANLRNDLAFKPENNVTAKPDLWIKTKHEIKKGEELLLSYNDGPDDEEFAFESDDE